MPDNEKLGIQDRWNTLLPKTRSIIMLAVGGVSLLIMFVLVFGGNGPSKYSNRQGENRGKDQVDQHALGGGRTNRASLEQMSAQMRAVKESVATMQKQITKEREANDKLRQEIGDMNKQNHLMNGRIEKGLRQTRSTARPLPNKNDDNAVIEDPFVSVDTSKQYPLKQTIKDPTPIDGLQNSHDSIVIQPAAPRRLIVLGKPEEAPAVPPQPGNTPPPPSNVVVTEDPPSAAVEEEVILMPTGSVISGVLLHGTDAPASVRAKGEPVPVLIEVTDLSMLPNAFSADMRECRIIAGVYGDLSTERAKFRSERMSCINLDGNTVDLRMEGYGVSNYDGIEGLKGPVVMRNGALLAKSILAATAADILSAYTLGYGRSLGGTGNEVDIGTAFVQGSGSGTSDGLNRIADYYLDRAEAIYAVIEIDSGRAIDFVLNRPMTIKVGDKAALGEVLSYTIR